MHHRAAYVRDRSPITNYEHDPSHMCGRMASNGEHAAAKPGLNMHILN